MESECPAADKGRSPLALLLVGATLFVLGLLLWRSPATDGAIYHAFRLSAAGRAHPVSLLTHLGGFAVLGPVALLAAVALWTRRRHREALWLAATIASGRIAIELIKLLVRRARPPEADWLVPVHSWSFPSSHSAGTMLTCVALALIARRRPPWLIAAIAAGGAIGWSRVALGVHWPSDVLAGWGFALFWAGAAARLVPPRGT